MLISSTTCRSWLPLAVRHVGLLTTFSPSTFQTLMPDRPDFKCYGNATKRRAEHASVTDEDIAFFTSALGQSGVLLDKSDIEPYNQDWMKQFQGQGPCVLLPHTADQVQALLRYCHQQRLPVVPQGGNTGLVGGSVPVYDEVVLNLSKMNKIIYMDKVSGVLTCEAGCILQVLEEYCGERGYMMPLDLGAKGSCQIGGNVSTNAGNLAACSD